MDTPKPLRAKDHPRIVIKKPAKLLGKSKVTTALNPNPRILVKLGSIAVHVEEYFSHNSHAMDKLAIEGLLSDPDLKDWIKQMTDMGLMPNKR